MKRQVLITLLFGTLFMNRAEAQYARYDETISVPNTNVRSALPAVPSAALLSKANIPQMECISPQLKQQVQQENEMNRQQLKAAKHPFYNQRSSLLPSFAFPIQPKAGFSDYGYYTVQNLVDHNAAYPNQLLDYNCGSRTYDFATGNHEGTDYIYWPYAWRKMDEDIMEVYAAAPGIIINKRNAYPDHNCLNNGNFAWNGIIVEHADGSEAWYWHFKTGSATTKNIGDAVVAGEYLGLAGSSGSSDWPHLHFQVNDANGNFVDPYAGSCNPTTATSLWQTQHPYDVPSINRICTKSSQIDWYDCPNPEITYEKDTFQLGDSLWLWAYTRDMTINSTMQLNMYNPSGANVLNWSFTNPWPTYPTTYVRWYYIIDPWFVNGTWTFEIVYEGTTYQHQFVIGQPSSVGEIATSRSCYIAPNPSRNQIQVSLPEGRAIESVTIMDQLGKEIYHSTINDQVKINVDCSNFSSGVYHVKATSREGIYISKLVKE